MMPKSSELDRLTSELETESKRNDALEELVALSLLRLPQSDRERRLKRNAFALNVLRNDADEIHRLARINESVSGFRVAKVGFKVNNIDENDRATMTWRFVANRVFPELRENVVVELETKMVCSADLEQGFVSFAPDEIDKTAIKLRVAKSDADQAEKDAFSDLLVVQEELSELVKACSKLKDLQLGLSSSQVYLDRSVKRLKCIESLDTALLNVSKAADGLSLEILGEKGKPFATMAWTILFDFQAMAVKEQYGVKLSSEGMVVCSDLNFPDEVLNGASCKDWTAEQCFLNLTKASKLIEPDQLNGSSKKKRRTSAMAD